MKYSKLHMIPMISPIIAIAIGLSAALSGRDVARATLDPSIIWAGTSSPLSDLLLQIITISIVAICVLRIFYVLVTREKIRHEAWPLFHAFLGYFLASVVLNGIFGSKPSFDHHKMYPLIVLTAVFVEPKHVIELSIQAAKKGLIALLVISGLAALLIPSLAVQKGYDGLLPLVDIRFWGLGAHPNSLGALSLLLLLLLVYQPLERRWQQYGTMSFGIIILLLTQSKTSLLAAFISYGILRFYRNHWRPGFRHRLLIISILALGIAVVISLFMVFDAGELLARWATTKEGTETMTLTGRDRIWAIAVEAWQKNPLFGYGPSMWNDDFRSRIHMNFAFSAHNQFLQSLGAAGLIGLLGLIGYLSILMKYAMRTAERTKGLTLALFSMLLIRCITETPLELGTILNGDFMTHLLFVQLLVYFGTISAVQVTMTAKIRYEQRRS